MSRTYRSKYNHSTAVIDETMCRPYDGAEKTKCFRTICTDSDGFVYHVSCFETLEDALHDLRNCGFTA